MSDSQKLIAHVAPTLGSALNGPLANATNRYIAQHLGEKDVPAGTSLEPLLAAYLDDPDNLQKVKDVDEQFKIDMEKLEIDVFSLEVGDRQSNEATNRRNIRPQLLISIVFVFAYFGVLAGVMYAELSPKFNPGMAFVNGEWVHQGESLLDLIQILLGVLTGAVAQVLNYWFGGGNSRKQESA